MGHMSDVTHATITIRSPASNDNGSAVAPARNNQNTAVIELDIDFPGQRGGSNGAGRSNGTQGEQNPLGALLGAILPDWIEQLIARLLRSIGQKGADGDAGQAKITIDVPGAGGGPGNSSGVNGSAQPSPAGAGSMPGDVGGSPLSGSTRPSPEATSLAASTLASALDNNGKEVFGPGVHLDGNVLLAIAKDATGKYSDEIKGAAAYLATNPGEFNAIDGVAGGKKDGVIGKWDLQGYNHEGPFADQAKQPAPGPAAGTAAGSTGDVAAASGVNGPDANQQPGPGNNMNLAMSALYKNNSGKIPDPIDMAKLKEIANSKDSNTYTQDEIDAAKFFVNNPGVFDMVESHGDPRRRDGILGRNDIEDAMGGEERARNPKGTGVDVSSTSDPNAGNGIGMAQAAMTLSKMDRPLTADNLKEMANNPAYTTQQQNAAQFMLANPALWKMAAGDDGIAGSNDLARMGGDKEWFTR